MNAHNYISWCIEKHLSYGALQVIAAIVKVMENEDSVRFWLIEDATTLCSRSVRAIARDLTQRGLATSGRGMISLTEQTLAELKAL